MKISVKLPGVLFALAIGVLSILISRVFTAVSPLLLALAIGIIVGNLGWITTRMWPGVRWSAKKFLRLGIALLGLQLSLNSLIELGIHGILLLITVVVVTFFSTLLIGKALGVSRVNRYLVATGFSICGASAVAAMSSVIDPKQESEEDVAQAIALVTLYGTLAMLALPPLSIWLGLTQSEAGLWIGASVHEVAQVVAAGGVIGATALTVATVAKLGRVVLLAPLVAAVGVRESLRQKAAAQRLTVSAEGARLTEPDEEPNSPAAKTPIVPLYVIAFVGLVVLGSVLSLPAQAVSVAGLTSSFLLAVAMFGLGTGVNLKKMIRTGGCTSLLGAASTLIASGVALAGVLIIR